MVEGFRRYLAHYRTPQQKTEPGNLNVEQAISLAAGSAEANQLVSCGNDVIACILHVKDRKVCAL